jgi:uncharacterized protein YbjQ (UPF0145 family)
MSNNKCPNCDASLKGMFSPAVLIPQSKTDFINKHLSQDKEAYCSDWGCSGRLLDKIAQSFSKQKSEIETRLKRIIQAIPILTSPAPFKWEYEIIDMISAQTTSGTGFVMELSRSFNDFFGAGSNATNQKVESATNLCKADLRIQCVRLGGNAVISADIDFNEIGSGSSNMLMVCMAGTAIRITDMKVFNSKRSDTIAEIVELTEQLESIAKLAK